MHEVRRPGEESRTATQDQPAARIDITHVSTVIFDVDGTLLDSNAAHAEAWAGALHEHGIRRAVSAIRPLIGMGGDKLLPAVAGIAEDSPEGQAVAARKRELFAARLPHLLPTPGARPLAAYLRSLGKDVVVATSAGEDEVHGLLRQAGVDDLFPARSTKDDAGRSKPDPDIVCAALDRTGSNATGAIMIGDTPYDIEAARRAGVGAIALRCGGGWTDHDLSGAVAIFDSPEALLRDWQSQARR